MFGFLQDMDMRTETKHGIDKLKLMLFFMPVFEAKSNKRLNNSLNRLCSFVCQQLKRGISHEEKLDLYKGIHNYIMSDEGTNERFNSMEYLFEMKFIKD